ncbi:peptidylprolyl isomerase [Adhaeribacter sp. BT258]|uniref:Peptidylprolyl isomerase n=1 Tax=Adhaeribacter terrigena TaxID=2793070 RepID=A0ABS1BX56_9BACT|nr:peptidylprolyl isomerase [Adhaeribacter terrigena]MBK0401481.1 peptidylprolyl isomerase [Adhaeribacter terrigena]
MRNYLLAVGAAALILTSCKSSKEVAKQEPVLETIGSKPVYTSEFQYVYNKNNANAENAYSKGSIEEYLNLYTNFKLKVMEAEARGLDTTDAFSRELDGYKQQLAQPYLTEKSVTDKLVREAYDRMQKEVNASHILINVAPDADPKDTLAAYNRISEIRKQIVGGQNFESVAKEVSQDPSARENGGKLGYFTALQMVYPFEHAAYNTPVGQVSQPVRTRFGYHIIKVNDMRQAQGEIKVAHIMVRATPGMPKADSAEAKRKVDEIYSRVKKNENWDKLTSQFSEDAGSSGNGGELPWFGTGRMIPSFEDAAFNLKNVGDISQPVLTPYGWHIIKLLEKRTLPTYEETEASLRAKVAKDSRSELNKAAFLKRIRTENKFTEIKAAKELALSKADSSVVKGTFKYTPAGSKDKTLETPLFLIQDKKYTIKDFFDYVQSNQQIRKNHNPRHYMESLYNQFVDVSLLNYEKANLENKYVDYKMLVKEYRDGILLFQLMDEKVWSKAIEDTTGLKAYFEQNKEKYKWDTRAQATIISAASKDMLNRADKALAGGRFEDKKQEPKSLAFDAGKDAFTKQTQAKLDELIQQLSSDSTLSVEVRGSADSKEVAKNKKLAQTRAQKVASYLTSKGIAANRVKTVANPKGKTRTVGLTYYSTDPAVLESTLNEGNPLAVQITQKKFQKGENKALDGVTWQPGTYNVERDGRFMLIKIDQILPPSYKTLNEARGIATSDYQGYLEKQWIEELRQKYPVKVNQSEVDKLVKK